MSSIINAVQRIVVCVHIATDKLERASDIEIDSNTGDRGNSGSGGAMVQGGNRYAIAALDRASMEETGEATDEDSEIGPA
jgi:hypothetical protein